MPNSLKYRDIIVLDSTKPIPQFLKDFDIKEKVKKKRYEIRQFREDINRRNEVRNQISKV